MERFFRYSLTTLISLVALAQFIQVITRYVFEVPVMGLEEAAIYPALWLYMLGAVNAAREDNQIKANVLEIFLHTERARHILQVIAESLSLAISGWLTWWAWDYFKYAKRVSKETATLYWPTFFYECALFIGLVLITAFIAWHLARNLRALKDGTYGSAVPADDDLPITTEASILLEENQSAESLEMSREGERNNG